MSSVCKLNAVNPFRASSIMPIATVRNRQAHLGRGSLPAVLLSVLATLAVIVPVAAIFFRSDKTDFQASGMFRANQQEQQQTTSGEEAINDRAAAEKFLATTRGTKAINNSLAAEDQFLALSARLSTLQDAMT